MTERIAKGEDRVSVVLNTVAWRAALARLLPLAVALLGLGALAIAIAIAWRGAVRIDLALAIVAVTLVAIVAVLAFALRPARAVVLARRLDYALGLSEQLSTSIDVAADGGRGPVVRSLEEGAARALSGIDIRQAIPLYSRPLGVALGFLLVAVCGAAAAYGLIETRPQPVELVAAAPEPEAAPPIAADDLDVLAQLLSDDAQRRNSDYLEALANSVKNLAEAARQGTPPADIAAQLETLLDHAAAGYDGQLPNWMSDMPGNASSTLQSAVAFSTARQQAAEQRARLAETGGTRVNSADMYDMPAERMNQSAASQTPGNSKPMDGKAADREGELTSDSLGGGGDFAATPMEDEAFESAGSLPVGAAAQSGKGESNIAGGGSQALAESTGFLETMADPTEVMSIAADQTTEGSRIRMHVPTSAELTEAGTVAGGSDGAWDRQVAQSVTRQVIAPQASGAVSRYFNRATAQERL